MQDSEKEFQTALVLAVPKLRRYAYALARTVTDADDLLQATLERALLKQHQFQPGTELDRWMFRICRNLWIDEMRTRKIRNESVELNEMTGPVMDGGRSMEAVLGLSEVQAVMRNMREEYREILALVAMAGLSYKEAAATLNVPIGTVMSRLARARAEITTALNV